MLPLNGRCLVSKLSAFRALVYHYTVVLLLLAEHCGGQFQLVGPSQPIVVLVGGDAILPCSLEPAADVVYKSVEWARLDLEATIVHVWHQGENLLDRQNPSYQGRTSLSTEKLRHGDLSLRLSKVKHSDNGVYRCYFPSQGKSSTAELIVGSVSSPVIAETKINSSTVVLTCESRGWYPEPELLWLNAAGKMLSAGPTETVRGPDDLYTVSSRVTVENRRSNRFTCRVQQKTISQTTETHLVINADCHSTSHCSVVRLSIILVFVLVVICAAAFDLWIWKQNRVREKEEQKKKSEAERLLPKNKKMEGLEMEKAKLDQELVMGEKRHRALERAVKIMTEQVEELKEVCDKVKLLQVKMMIEDLSKKLQSVENDRPSDRAAGYLELKNIILNIKRQMEQTEEAQGYLYSKIVTLQNKTQSVLQPVTDIKNEGEKHKKNISERVKQIESERAEIQRRLQSEQELEP